MFQLYIEYGPIVVGLILSAIAWAYHQLIWEKVSDSRLGNMISAVGQELSAVIVEVNSTYVEELKLANADGKLTEEERVMAKRLAVDKFKENWGSKGIARMAKILGIGGSIDSWLGTQIEASLDSMKSDEPLAKLPIIDISPKE